MNKKPLNCITISVIQDGEEKGLGLDLDSAETKKNMAGNLTMLFRSALHEVFGDKYRLDIIERPPSSLTGLGQLSREE